MSEPTNATPEEGLRLFEAADFPAYRAWYADAELDAHLGPMDEDWLTFVLADKDGRQFSYLAQEKLVAVIGVNPLIATLGVGLVIQGVLSILKSGTVDDFPRYAQPNASYSVFELINGRCTALKWGIATHLRHLD